MNPATILSICAAAFLLGGTAAGQQENPKPVAAKSATPSAAPSSSATDDDLLDGLLDLIPDEARPSSPNGSTPVDLRPEDVGLSAEEVNEANGPLQPIRQSMLISAGLLRRGDKEVATLQADILTRLDEWIAQIESLDSRSSQSQDQSAQQEQSNTQDSSQQSREEQVQRVPGDSPGEPGDKRDPKNSGSDAAQEGGSDDASRQTGSDMTGQPSDSGGTTGAVRVELNAPEAYQQRVWGLLPERIRASMQTRMVEQFLPTHREQIEVYYQKLLERYREDD